MVRMVFAHSQVRVPQEYLIGEESPGLAAFWRMLPPFVHLEVVQEGTLEEEDMIATSAIFEAGGNLARNFQEFSRRLIGERMGRSSKEFTLSKAAGAIGANSEGKKLGIPLLRAMIAEVAQAVEAEYIDGVTKVYIIHPPTLEDELIGQLSGLPVPPMADSESERMMSIPVNGSTQAFVVLPYAMDLPGHRSPDPKWLIVHLYNPDLPALVMRVREDGPWTFREPTPLLSDTKDAENWAMGQLRDHLYNEGVDIRFVSEPNGPGTFPDFRATIAGEKWDVEVTRVLGDLMNNRHVPDRSRDSRRVIERAAQSPEIGESDVERALNQAIRSKASKRPSVGKGFKYCLLLVNAAGLNVGEQSPVWQDKNLSSFDAIVLMSGYTHPKIEFIKGRLWCASMGRFQSSNSV